MSAGPLEPPSMMEGLSIILWRMVMVAGAWFGLLALVMALSAPDAAPGAARQLAPAPAFVEPPAAEIEPPRTRALRHGSSGAAPALVP